MPNCGIKSFKEKSMNIVCSCGYSFCSNCRETSHRPLSCELFGRWQDMIGGKNQSNNLDDLWTKINTKKCPGCKKNIEKNMGCMHMTCPCGKQFCWLCLKDWLTHKNCNSVEL